MENVVRFDPVEGFIDESASLFDLCRQGDTRAFILYHESTLVHHHFAAVKLSNDNYALYAQAEVEGRPTYLFHFEAVVQGNLPDVIQAARELLEGEWLLLTG